MLGLDDVMSARVVPWSQEVSPAGAGASQDAHLLRDIVLAVLARAERAAWAVHDDGTWCRVSPRGQVLPDQGWKLHVSATLLAAPLVLARVAGVLVAERCAFKFSSDLSRLRELLSSSVDRGTGGKFVTVYPGKHAALEPLARRLHDATAGLPGPAVLSDRPYRPGSLVHYRFGRFVASHELTNDGAYDRRLVGPDGRRVPDERRAWFSVPDWAGSPFAHPAPEGPADGVVVLGGRFVVRSAIRHSFRGGVFRAEDRETGRTVVVKQARPHAMPALDGSDARTLLRHEAEVLDRLGPPGLAPRRIALFTHQDHVFLAEEEVDGTTLAAWTAERVLAPWRGRGAPVGQAVALARQLVELVGRVHAEGFVLRDLTPANVMVTTGEQVRLVDFEHASTPGAPVWKAFTPGYTAPEVALAPAFGAAPPVSADLYGLGATILHLASGRSPALEDDDPPGRSGQDRLEHLVRQQASQLPAVRHLAPLVLGLTRDDPAARWPIARARAFLTCEPRFEARPDDEVRATPDDALRATLDDGLAFLVETMTPGAATLWRADDAGAQSDPCNVQHGAAGVLGVLTRACSVLGSDPVRSAVGVAAAWIDRRVTASRPLPGLYYGRAGTAWALFDAGTALGDDRLTARALDLARRLPLSWPNPDVCHGAAGTGLALLHLWDRTGDPGLGSAVGSVADTLLREPADREGRPLWSVPPDFDSTLAGSAHYGFAHGAAGIGCFLLYAGLATGRDRYLDAARRTGDLLESVADLEDSAAWWPAGPDTGPARLPHWCSGSAGAGTFLVRLWSATRESRYRDLAEAAAVAVHRHRWYWGPGTCHGLAGHGEFLLDLAQTTGDERYRTWAEELFAVLHAGHVVRGGRMLVPDDRGDVLASYQSGVSGTVGLLLRLRLGGPRWWLPDGWLEPDTRPLLTGRPRPVPDDDTGKEESS